MDMGQLESIDRRCKIDMKVFVSHKKEDSTEALHITRAFISQGVKAYLDLLDNIEDDGKALTDHIKTQLNSCTDIIVVMSENTKRSWWVPFEIGMATQIDMPTASFLTSTSSLPSYLSYWPRLRSTTDVKKYVEVRKTVERKMQLLYENYSIDKRRRFETPEFYKQLKAKLG